MEGFWEFADKHPIAAIVLAVIAAYFATSPFRYAFRIYNRRLRNKNILAHGWPTPPMDADGDVVYKDKS